MASNGPPLNNCPICWRELEEQKPLLLDSENVERFKRAFRSFCALINATNDGLVDEIAVIGGCGDCCGALNEIERLERAIEEMQAAQIDLVEKLKLSLLLSPTQDDGFIKLEDSVSSHIRRQLIGCILSGPMLSGNGGDAHTSPPSAPPLSPISPQASPAKRAKLGRRVVGAGTKILPNCRVVLERISLPATSVPPPEVNMVSSTDPESARAPLRRNCREGRKPVSVGASDYERDNHGDDFDSPSSSASEDDEDLEYVSKSKNTSSRHPSYIPGRRITGRKEAVPVAPRPHGGSKKKLNNYFYRIDDTTLLHKFTLIQVSLSPDRILSDLELRILVRFARKFSR